MPSFENGLKKAINIYLETSDSLQIISNDGLTQEDVKNASGILDNIFDANLETR